MSSVSRGIKALTWVRVDEDTGHAVGLIDLEGARTAPLWR
jgi:hypothetical protein